MKQLSIEEKAKCYDEAIDKVAHFIKKHIGFGCMIHPNSSEAKELFNIFPELKGSEDERIRKVIYGWIYTRPSQFFDNGFSKEQMLAWLEKQGNANKEYWRGYREGKQEILDKYAELEKHSEQKPADNNPKQKSAWSEERIDEINRKIFPNHYGGAKVLDTYNPVWSEEDEKKNEDEAIRSNPIPELTSSAFRLGFKLGWFKALEERVQSNQEWKQPELKESEDERIRERLIFDFKVLGKTEWGGLEVKDIIAWLEKQKAIDVLDEEEREFADNVDSYRKEVDAAYQKGYNEGVKATLKEQGEIDKVSYDIAEKEKYDFVSGQFIECRKSFNEFKENNSYWFEYVGNDTYIGRSDNILNKKFHITPRQLYRLFAQQHCPKENNINEETNSPTGYGKYIDECLNEAAEHFFSEGEDKYSVADLFYAGVRCGKSWLKKQGEQKHKIQPKFKIGDIIRFKGNETLKGEAETHKIISYDNELYVFDDGTTDLFCEQDLYELVEQKPADKVEPKFHKGDWVVCEVTGSVYQIKDCIENLSNHKYGYDLTNDGYIDNNETNHYHLWTIQDAKDGDVLKEDSCTFIIERMKPDGTAVIHCCLFDDGDFELGSTLSFDVDSTYPATKKQRDTLMKAMADAGHTFDFEKKELKKIEQKPAELFENRSKELSLSLQIQAYLSTASDELYAKGKPLYSEKRIEDIHKCMLMWQRLHNSYFYRKSDWSDEDENRLKTTFDSLNTYAEKAHPCLKSVVKDEIDWLKSLKNRVQAKQEWSEEDEKIYQSIMDDTVQENQLDGKQINWLKFLKERYTWKPSDKQMEALEHFVRSTGESGYASPYDNNTKLLYSLLSDLKKLKG